MQAASSGWRIFGTDGATIGPKKETRLHRSGWAYVSLAWGLEGGEGLSPRITDVAWGPLPGRRQATVRAVVYALISLLRNVQGNLIIAVDNVFVFLCGFIRLLMP